MKRRKVFFEDGLEPNTMTTTLAAALEDIALGEADVADAAKAISMALARPDRGVAASLYESLRSWVWKTLEARRRDDELLEWLDMIGRVSSSLRGEYRDLALKLETCVELLHTSVARASATASPSLERKHVRSIMQALLRSDGTMRKRDLQEETGLKEANLARVMAPLRDAGWVTRQMDGKAAIYSLSDAGRRAVPADLLQQEVSQQQREKTDRFIERYVSELRAFPRKHILPLGAFGTSPSGTRGRIDYLALSDNMMVYYCSADHSAGGPIESFNEHAGHPKRAWGHGWITDEMVGQKKVPSRLVSGGPR